MWREKEIESECIDNTLESVQHFFIYGILPEVIGKWYTTKLVANLQNVVLKPIPVNNSRTDLHDNEDVSKLWCYNYQPSYGEMILCDNKKCTFKWFRFDCIHIRSPPVLSILQKTYKISQKQ